MSVAMVMLYNCHDSEYHPPSCLVFETKHFGDSVCLYFQVEPTQLGLINRANLCLALFINSAFAGVRKEKLALFM
jgi:hypothetical protein